MPPNAANLKYMIELTKEWNECLILPKLRPSICFFIYAVPVLVHRHKHPLLEETVYMYIPPPYQQRTISRHGIPLPSEVSEG